MGALVKRLAGLPFETGARLRGWAYDRGLLPVRRVGLPVLSVGNLSVGGTGKTPLVIHLVERLQARGRRPAVVARGYGRRPGEELNDEGRLLRRRFPDLPQFQDPNRVAAAEEVARRGEADLVILDDAFQHRRLHRDLDLVCLDATRPWHEDALLPGGRLREPPSALARADLLVLTRTEGLTAAARRRLAERARCDAPGRPLLVSRHAPRDLLSPEGASLPLAGLRNRRVHLFAGIAAPAAFARSVEELGARVAGLRVLPDHGAYTPRRLEGIARDFRASGAEWLLTTEKDLARAGSFPFPVHTLRIDLRIEAGEEQLEAALDALEAGA